MRNRFAFGRLQPVLRQYGVSMVELLGAIAIGSVVMTGVVQQTNSYIDNTKDAYTAEHARMYAQAARGYIKELKNDPSLPNGTSVTPSSKLDPYLPPGFSAAPTNPYGQTPQLVTSKTTSNNSSTVQAFLVYRGGADVPAGRRQFIAAMAGLGGGYVDVANQPKGSGWNASGGYFGNTLAPAQPGKVVMSLNVFEPADVLDRRYVCRSNGDGVCNRLDTDLLGNDKSITNLSQMTTNNLISYGPTTLSSTVNIYGRVNATSSVIVGGGLVADTLRSNKVVVRNSTCVGADLGAIARQAMRVGDTSGTGTLLTCKQATDRDGNPLANQYKWQPVYSTREETGYILGCYQWNDFCRKRPQEFCDDNQELCKKLDLRNISSSVTRSPRKDSNGNYPAFRQPVGPTAPRRGEEDLGVSLRNEEVYNWTAVIQKNIPNSRPQKPLFCALGFVAQTPDTSSEYTVRNTNQPFHTGATFCRVWPVMGDDGEVEWKVRASSMLNTQIACHAVCIYD